MKQLRPKCSEWVIFDQRMPFDVARAVHGLEARGIDHPRIWTDQRDIEMWKTLEGVA